ncbi:MAG: hypothetical protein DDT27_00795 [Dehalococcoidia bacterium]|nr:hypothetical protein [Chloroflexota bacterium]MBT9160285.1 hypothetical protein [Chloroflexota bacterium]MBT9162249.1 hypothetical protein [Chloroflexota bacterium]
MERMDMYSRDEYLDRSAVKREEGLGEPSASAFFVISWQFQRAKVGYDPGKPGRKSFHPLLCFIWRNGGLFVE